MCKNLNLFNKYQRLCAGDQSGTPQGLLISLTCRYLPSMCRWKLAFRVKTPMDFCTDKVILCLTRAGTVPVPGEMFSEWPVKSLKEFLGELSRGAQEVFVDHPLRS